MESEYTEDVMRAKTNNWFARTSEPNWLHRQIINVLKCGSIPKHVAFIMDGNRRFAKERHREKIYGHLKGFDTLTETLEWCLDLGINEVTVYAFSIENFKRSEEEVTGLLNLFRVKMKQLVESRDKLEEHGVCVRVLGNISLLPTDLQILVKEAVSMSSNFNRFIGCRAYLNVCIAYTSREEITQSIKSIAQGVAMGKLEESDVDEQLIESCLYTTECQPVDVLLRTSGEVRLSDFLLWQSTYSVLSFVKVLWPDFSRWDLYAAVLYYQWHLPQILKIKEQHRLISQSALSRGEVNSKDEASEMRKAEFVNQILEGRKAYIPVQS